MMEAPKDEELRKQIEQGYEVGEPTSMMLSVTGEPYTELLGLGGPDGAMEVFREYAKDKKGHLYWRVTPEVECSGKFYMRLLISDRKPKQEA